jgi:hypothetical protein
MIGRSLAVLAILAIGVLLFTNPVSAAQRLTESQIRALAPGHYIGSWKKKTSVNLRLEKNGTIHGYVKGVYRSGKWYVSKGRFCLEFSFLFVTKTECGEIARDGGWYIGLYNKKGVPRLRMRSV